jgi:hypothetical protein
MRHRAIVFALLLACGLFRSGQRLDATPQDAPPLPPAIKQANDQFVSAILSKIVGHENEPAGQVFQNIQMFKNIPARQVLTIMSVGCAPALGVACTHCHVEKDFASDDKRPKRAAREMAVMHRSVNDQLAKMQNLVTPPTENRSVNCAVCHRGKVNPRAGGL